MRADGKILLVNNNTISLIKTDGLKDPAFKFNYKLEGNTSDVKTLVEPLLQKDGKIIVTGRFTKLVDNADNTKVYNYQNLVRLNANGTVDASFQNPASTNGVINIWLLSDDSFLGNDLKEAYTNLWVETLHHYDKDGKTISTHNVNGMIEGLVSVKDNKALTAGNFFEPYDLITVVFAPHDSGTKPTKEISLQ